MPSTSEGMPFGSTNNNLSTVMKIVIWFKAGPIIFMVRIVRYC
jgi:hypothetical protein